VPARDSTSMTWAKSKGSAGTALRQRRFPRECRFPRGRQLLRERRARSGGGDARKHQARGAAGEPAMLRSSHRGGPATSPSRLGGC